MTDKTPFESTRGIHHVTAIAGDAQRNLDFYVGVLGLRMVKRTVNFDDPGTYHLYYGDEEGRPGTIMTFFPWKGAPRGSLGAGQTSATSFSVPEGSLGYWRERLTSAGLPVESPRRRFDEETLVFADPDGLRLELVAHAGAAELSPWSDGPVPEERAIRAFHGVTLLERSLDATAAVLTGSFGYVEGAVEGARHRFVAPAGGAGSVVDVVVKPDAGFGRVAVGSVHHVAFRVADDEAQGFWRERALLDGLGVTDVRDRSYFRSVYFREPGGVLFEVATDTPGFAVDESVAELGSSLRLPPWLEARRGRLEEVLPPLTTPLAAVEAS
jgi:glyoxalase family protein